MATDWTNRAISILGLSKSGAAVARYVARRGGKAFISEYSDAKPEQQDLLRELEALGVDVETGGHSDCCVQAGNLTVISPGIPPTAPIVQQLGRAGVPVISEVEFAYREAQALPTRPQWIGITGTNGKTTTTTLISALLTHGGLSAPVCGNIGRPITEVVDVETPDVLVAELSSYQLAFSDTLAVDIAVFLNLTPDHLDWHGSLEAYREAKLSLFAGERSPKVAVLKADDPVSDRIRKQTRAHCIGFGLSRDRIADYPSQAYVDADGTLVIALEGQPACRLMHRDDLTILGNHNIENVLAAASVALHLGVACERVSEACRRFPGVEHRLEYVTTLDGVAFYNDSKATNPESSISALNAFVPGQVVLIAGGKDKLTPLVEWVDVVRRTAAHVVLFGQAAQRFEDVLRADGYVQVERAETLEDAVRRAQQASQNRPEPLPVLFSPACASFDMFNNFEHRGRQFKQCVQTLACEKPAPVAGHPSSLPG